MKIGFAQYGSLNQEFNEYLSSLEEQINNLVKNESYGDDLKEIYIGIICVSPEFDSFFKVSKPKYQKDNKTYIKEGIKYELNKTFQYDVKLEFNLFKSLKGNDLKKEFVLVLFKSFDVFKSDNIKKKIKDFDSTTFLQDLELFFKSEELL